jgi:hypothetical protein
MPNRSDPKQLKNKMSALAERIALEGFGKRLDYSIDSIQHVEHILGAMHDDYKSSGSEEGLQGIALEFGAYIIKVVERHFGPVDWQRNHPSFGEDSFPAFWKGSTLFPVGWCLKRIVDGDGDNVWFKFRTLMIDRSTRDEDTNVTR